MTPLERIAKQFGFVPEENDNQKPLATNALPIAGIKATVEPRDVLKASDHSIRNMALETIQEAKDQTNSAGSATITSTPTTVGQTGQPVTTSFPFTIAPTLDTSSTQNVSEVIKEQNQLLTETLVGQQTQTNKGKKTVTKTYSLTPSVPIDKQRLVKQSQETRDGVKTVVKVFSQ